VQEIDDVVLQVQAKTITIDDSGIQVSSNVDEDAAEGAAAESLESQAQSVLNIVHSHRLVETSYEKKALMGYLKTYMKRIKTHLEAKNPSRVDAFMKGAQAFVVGKLLPKFDDLKFFVGESSDYEAAMGFAFYPEGSTDATFWFFKDGLRPEKY
jgi:hypothetical protein